MLRFVGIDTAGPRAQNGALQKIADRLSRSCPLFVVQERSCRMLKATLALTCFLCVGLVSPLRAEGDSLVRFDGGIGVIPVSSATVNADGSVTINRNIVRGVNPPGQPWVIAGLEADVETDGQIIVRGQGLLLAGGDNIGFTAN